LLLQSTDQEMFACILFGRTVRPLGEVKRADTY
jgi:hypothetical protein